MLEGLCEQMHGFPAAAGATGPDAESTLRGVPLPGLVVQPADRLGEEVRTFRGGPLLARKRCSSFRAFGLSLRLNSGCLQGPVSSGSRTVGADRNPISGLTALGVMFPPCLVSTNQPGLSALESARKPLSSSRKALVNKGMEEQAYMCLAPEPQ